MSDSVRAVDVKGSIYRLCVMPFRGTGGLTGEPCPSGKNLVAEKTAWDCRKPRSGNPQRPVPALLGGLIFYFALCSSAHDDARSRHTGTPRPGRRFGLGW